MLILNGTSAIETAALLTQVQKDTTYPIMLYSQWLTDHDDCCHDDHHQTPTGIIYLRTLPDTTFQELFIEQKNIPAQLQELPIIVLNGNIDFQTNFAHYYNHLFYIKKLINQIQEQRDRELGITKHYRKCC
jgi:hypothetical protein